MRRLSIWKNERSVPCHHNCIVGRHREVDLVRFDCTLFIVIVVLFPSEAFPYTDPEVDLASEI